MQTVGGKGNGGDFHGPVKTRSCTDVFFLFLMAVFTIALVGLLGYCVHNGDIYRILNGYDSCGNVCGKQNKPDPKFDCKGGDKTNDKYLLITEAGKAIINPKNVARECVSSCRPGFQKFINRCVPEESEKVVNSFFSKTGLKDFLQEASEDLHLCWREILYLCLIAFALSVVLLFLFRYLVSFVVWIVLVSVVLVSVLGTIFLWVRYKMVRDKLVAKEDYRQSEISQRTHYTLLAYAILATIATVIILLVVLVMRKRIQLVVQLFREAGKAVASMPFLLCQPLLTFVCLALIVGLWLYFTLWIETSGVLTQVPNSDSLLYYKKDVATKVTRWYNLFALFWFSQFMVGCQHMVIAGAVTTWFFTRNKDNLDAPITSSASNLVRYHLGSIAFGSLLIALVQMARTILAWIQERLKGQENDVCRCLFRTCQCCLYCFEKILKYLTRNAYIEIAMYGHNFCQAGQQAFRMLSSNALRVAAINSVGDFVLLLGKALVVLATVLIGVEFLQGKDGVQHMWVPLGLAGLFAYLVSHCFLTVYEMVIDTIFLCFCEDCEQNDGINKPYYMSKGLMEFVEDSKKKLAVGDAKNVD